jgi:hypothetical protein
MRKFRPGKTQIPQYAKEAATVGVATPLPASQLIEWAETRPIGWWKRGRFPVLVTDLMAGQNELLLYCQFNQGISPASPRMIRSATRIVVLMLHAPQFSGERDVMKVACLDF